MAALLATLATFVACQQDEGLEALSDPDSEYVTIEFQTDAPELDTQEFGTRAVDPDGGGIRDMTLFCFDNFGLFITTVTATLNRKTEMTGTFTAKVPRYTRRIHFVANQNMTDFHDSAFINKSEAEVMALLEGSAGHMIYWARYACAFIAPQEGSNTQPTIADELKGKTITMLRNHARVSIDNPTNNPGKVNIKGIEAYNIYAFGTVAPYDPDKGFDFTLDEWKTSNYVTLPQRDAKQSDIREVTFTTHQYIFEHDNHSEDPISIILRGRPEGATADLYYRVLLIDENGDFVPVRRNHDYKLHINGALSFGQPTFEEALTASATNNVWISISDRVNEVEDAGRVLRVTETYVVKDDAYINQFKSIVLTCSVRSKDGSPITAADQPTLSWLDNTITSQEVRFDEFKINDDKTEGTGTIVISPRALGDNNRLEGTILVKLGRLQRKIKVVLLKRQEFAPSWVSTAVFSSDDPAEIVKDRPHVSLMFTIPESCPKELFPMNVYITVSNLDVRSESKQALTVISRNDPDWDESCSSDGPKDADYKFVYTVEQPGPQRVYFESLLSHQEIDLEHPQWIYIEAQHFVTMKRSYTFSETRNAIMLRNTKRYNPHASDAIPEEDWGQSAYDEYLYYYRVPQKTGALVTLEMWLRERVSDQFNDFNNIQVIPADKKDEFLFYTQNLNNFNSGEYDPAVIKPTCLFSPYTDKAAAWQQSQNKNGGRMLMFKPIDPTTGKYTLHLYTNRARSAEMVRISSNLNWQPAVSTSDPDDTVADTPENEAAGEDKLYGGKMYRSFIFELVNYTPFRFGARLHYDGKEWGEADEPVRGLHDDIQEKVTEVNWSYEPERPVDIAIDVTSFEGPDSDNDSNSDGGDLDGSGQPETESVNPFGREFEIYIDAPMLEIDESRLEANKLNGDKLKADPSVPGRFIYTVDADRETERLYGMDKALNKDNSPEKPNQNGERKILPFKVKSIASAGDIVISSNEAQTVFYPKTFRVANESIKGKIKAQKKQDDGTMKDEVVRQNEFVAFERVSNGNRIGAVVMTADGEFELRLRKEYPLNWYGYEVAFHYEHDRADGTHHLHHATYPSLAAMYEALQNGETVILKGDN